MPGLIDNFSLGAAAYADAWWTPVNWLSEKITGEELIPKLAPQVYAEQVAADASNAYSPALEQRAKEGASKEELQAAAQQAADAAEEKHGGPVGLAGTAAKMTAEQIATG